jgi:hypothetical protein
MTKEQRWQELAIVYGKLLKIKTDIKIKYFDLVAMDCEYRHIDKYRIKKCKHRDHFVGKNNCKMDECPILYNMVTE